MDLAKIKQRQALAAGGGWKLKEGANNVRLFYFRHKITEADVKGGLYPREKLGKVEVELDRPVVVHFGLYEGIKGPVRSTPATVAKFEKLKAAKGDKIAGKMAPSSMFAVNLIDTDEKPRKMRYPLLPRAAYNAILKYIANEDYKDATGLIGGKLVGCKGRDFVINYDKSQVGAAKYSAAPREKEFCVVLNSDLEQSIRDFFSPQGWAVLGIKEAPGEEVEETAETQEEEAPVTEEETTTEETTSSEEEKPVSEEESPAVEEETQEEEQAEEVPAPKKPQTKPPAKPAKKGGKPARERSDD